MLIGGQNDDLLVGNGGADVLRGGEGDDTLAISDLSFVRLVGGHGTDTLRLDGNGISLDLTTLADNRILDVEKIDLRGHGANTLTLSVRDVYNLSDSSNTITILKDAEDTAHIGAGWTSSGSQVVDGVSFDRFVQGQATLLISVPDYHCGCRRSLRRPGRWHGRATRISFVQCQSSE